jgi:Fe2+ or Zn2+ uptake regulation protein
MSERLKLIMQSNIPNIFYIILDYCTTKSIELSKQQSLILEIICSHKEAIASYQILEKLKLNNATANRMTIHRCLDYLNKIGVIHKISFNNTYVPCMHLAQNNCQLLICTKCNKKIELSSNDLLNVFKLSSEKYSFNIILPIEIMGICKECSK